MSWVVNFGRSSIGSKLLMSLTGIVLLGFVVGHLGGNLLIFAGRTPFNEYAKFLHDSPGIVWTTRIVLLVAVVTHVLIALRLRAINQTARPDRYAFRKTVQATIASRSMLATGLLILAYVVYHLLHFTLAVTDASAAEFKTAGDIYGMVVTSFQSVPIVLVYVIANALLAWHLSHGVSSAFQTLGVHDPRYATLIRFAGPVVGVALGAGFILIPLCVLLGIVQP